MQFGRISKIALKNRNVYSINKMNELSSVSNYMIAKRFGGHGPPTRYGQPHYWGGMVWGPKLKGVWAVQSIKFLLFFLICIHMQGKFPFPAHKYNMQGNLGRVS